MSTEKHKKRDIARLQIEAAVEHYEANEFIPALTLAGAGEEILGKMVKATGKKSALAERQAQTAVLYKLMWSGTSDPKMVANAANRARNEAKHHDSGKDSSVEFDAKEEARDMLDRAIENYFALTQDQTPTMKRYLDQRHAA